MVAIRHIEKVALNLLLALIAIYRILISPLLAALFGSLAGCRHSPTCSLYAQEALARHGLWFGGRLAILRLCRCHPWGTAGHDPVPHRMPQH